jgi:hypothetical protein
MKCQFCGKDTPVLYAGPNDEGICEECKASYEEEQANKIVEIKAEPAADPAEEPAEQSQDTVQASFSCAIVVGLLKNGAPYFNAIGDDVNLLTLDGLVKYAERCMKQNWDMRDLRLAQEAQKAAKEQEEKTE